MNGHHEYGDNFKEKVVWDIGQPSWLRIIANVAFYCKV